VLTSRLRWIAQIRKCGSQKIVGRENVMGGSDCGFARSPFARRVHPTIMWAELKSLVEGARIATQVLWGKQTAA
jgi:5-methyltetrahydropteroyltriglutamate--homocysteine methyltransferase